MNMVYDRIGKGYTTHRCADQRIVDVLADLIGLHPSVVLADVGAGTGNYSRAMAELGFRVEAIEPSATMRGQALLHASVTWHCGTAEQIPLRNDSVDGVFCVLAAHHFACVQTAAAEMARVCRSGPIVLLTFDPRQVERPWLADYFPTIWDGAFRAFPALADVCRCFADHAGRQVEVVPWLVPHDLQDCFMAAGWRRPEIYLDPDVRACMSGFALADSELVETGLSRLARDLADGRWQAKHQDLTGRDTVDWGYRFLKAT